MTGSTTGAERAADRAFGTALVLVGMSLAGFALALVFSWPSTFVVDEGATDGDVGAADFVNGTVTSIPLPPLLALLLGAAIVRRRDRWGAVGSLLLALLGVVFVIGGAGEITSDNDAVPTVVLLLAGLAYVLAGGTLLVTAVRALLARRRGPAEQSAADGAQPVSEP